MAHGGAPEWNAAVARAVEPLRARLPVALALGMADPRTLQAALDSLGESGVERVAVVRLFMSGESFLHQTEYLLGLRGDPPAEPMLHHGGGGAGQHGELHPLRHGMEVLLSRDGLGASALAGAILVDRADGASRDPGRERVLLVAHGMGDEGENGRVLAWMEESAGELRARGFQDVHTATLREDWPEARAVAEAEIRAWVRGAADGGARVIVVPFRLSGFGPYAQVLEGLPYVPTEGLLPHDLVSRWLEEQAARLLCPGGDGEGLPCAAAAPDR
ncbi:MAG: hypothetical protein AMXMBFR53_21430 [Gemmatimonadota bacterium]